MTYDPRWLQMASDAVALANRCIREQRHTAVVTPKGDRDMVTSVDVNVERAMRAYLREATPDIGFLGEEEGWFPDERGTHWVLDPIDGTANFSRGSELYAVSLALVRDRRAVVGVISLPDLGRRYAAVAGGGAARDGQRIEVSGTRELRHAIVALGDYSSGKHTDDDERLRRQLRLTERAAGRVQRVRMLGSMATDLAYVASGTLDASVTLSNTPWDTAAGVLIAREAGALVLDAGGGAHTPESRATIAVTPALRDPILDLVADTGDAAASVCAELTSG